MSPLKWVATAYTKDLTPLSEHALAIKALARQYQEAIWAWHQALTRLRSVLLEFYPQAIKAFPNLKHHAATAVLTAVPSPTAAASLTRRRIVALLHRCGRRNDPALVEQILTDLKAAALQQPAQVEAALALTVAGLLRIIVTMRTAVEQLEAALAKEFDSHDLAPVLRSAPGLGPVLAARVLAEVGDDPARFASVDGLRAFARDRTRHSCVGTFALRQVPEGAEQAAGRRLSLVGPTRP